MNTEVEAIKRRVVRAAENRTASPACMKLMSLIYRAQKHGGCKWCGNPRTFLLKNRWMFPDFEKRIKAVRPKEMRDCEQVLSEIAAGIVVVEPPKPMRSATGYQSLVAYLGTPKGKAQWRSVRFQAIKLGGSRCALCGAGPANGAVLHVDHIKPKSRFPELAFDLDNLQVLCEDCNLGKSNRDCTDFRR